VLQTGPEVMGTSPIGPFTAQAIWSTGSLSPHAGKMLYRQKEIKVTWRWVYQQREGKGHRMGERSRLGMPAMMITEERSFWH